MTKTHIEQDKKDITLHDRLSGKTKTAITKPPRIGTPDTIDTFVATNEAERSKMEVPSVFSDRIQANPTRTPQILHLYHLKSCVKPNTKLATHERSGDIRHQPTPQCAVVPRPCSIKDWMLLLGVPDDSAILYFDKDPLETIMEPKWRLLTFLYRHKILTSPGNIDKCSFSLKKVQCRERNTAHMSWVRQVFCPRARRCLQECESL